MKALSMIFLLLVSANGCSQDTETATKKEGKNNPVVEYEAASRGFFQKVRVTRDSISVANDRNSMYSVASTASQWNKIIENLNAIEIKNIGTLTPPTEKRTVDAAAHAVLRIKTVDTVYTSPTFDHGNPPVEIESLVKAILTLAKTVEKE